MKMYRAKLQVEASCRASSLEFPV